MEKISENKNYKMQGFYISAAKRNSGKTTISIAIMRLLRNKGLIVQSFKKGPDFIDPMWLSIATGKNCYNLDFYFMSKDKIKKHFLEHSLNSDINIVEGNHGLYDSIDLYGKSSNASMAKLLRLPVILVIDVGEFNRGVVPLLLGFRNFDKKVNIKGIILNKIHSKRHEKNLINAINYYTDLKVVGNIPNDPELSIKQRHLGLMSTLSGEDVENLVSNISSKISNYIDLEGIINISKIAAKSYADVNLKYNIITASAAHVAPPKKIESGRVRERVKIGIAYDGAFNFYYNENIETLENLGCEIIRFSPLKDDGLPKVDALYIGGGFPEIFCKDLEANSNLRMDIREKIEIGLPVYAECGGLMYLCKSISCDDIMYEMVGAIDADVKWTKKPKGHGYTKLTTAFYDKNSRLWFNKIKFLKGHEFHHSYLETPSSNNMNFAFNVEKGFGVNGESDGIIYKNIIASYTHIFSPSSPGWFKNWVYFIKEIKKDFLKIK
ncbi:MAG: cobyrinate a,c-diamide synthase [bacterium]